MLICHNITCSRNSKLLFKNLGFAIGAQGLLIIRGANGSGKTSLLKIITGIIAPDTGTVTWNKKNIFADYGHYKSSTIYIGHQNALNHSLTVRANLEFWAALFGAEERLAAAIHYFKLDRVLELEYHKLSAGWKKRTALAKLLISDAGLWLLDEPTANLDKECTNLLLDLVNTFCEREGIVIMTANQDMQHMAQDIRYADKLYIEDFINPINSIKSIDP